MVRQSVAVDLLQEGGAGDRWGYSRLSEWLYGILSSQDNISHLGRVVKAVDLSSLANYTLLTKVAQVRTLQMATDTYCYFLPASSKMFLLLALVVVLIFFFLFSLRV